MIASSPDGFPPDAELCSACGAAPCDQAEIKHPEPGICGNGIVGGLRRAALPGPDICTVAADEIEALRAVLAASPMAWLIEAAESDVSAPLYWAGYFGDERNHWTSDARKATWLARESDAAAVAKGVLHGYAVRVCQHAFD
jgi:hypothetical protein